MKKLKFSLVISASFSVRNWQSLNQSLTSLLSPKRPVFHMQCCSAVLLVAAFLIAALSCHSTKIQILPPSSGSKVGGPTQHGNHDAISLLDDIHSNDSLLNDSDVVGSAQAAKLAEPSCLKLSQAEPKQRPILAHGSG